MFGGRVSGNLLDTLLALFDWWVPAQGVPYTQWVVWTTARFASPRCQSICMTLHTAAESLAVQSWMCKDAYARACKFQKQVLTVLKELGFTFNEKLQPPAQRGEFIGMSWDTLNCTFWMSAVKAKKMAGVAESMVEAGVASRLELAKLLGKLVWFSLCLHAVRLLTLALNAFVGSPATNAPWDVQEALPESVLVELSHWASALPTQAS
eukprot:1633881-Rhodomonas_salina.1